MSKTTKLQEVVGLAKMPTGIEGFDEISGGGLPRERTSLVVGGPGSGKTIFALQTLVNGARQLGEPGIFVAFEESSRQIIANAASFGWDLRSLVPKRLYLFDAQLTPDTVRAGQFDLAGLLAGLGVLAAKMGAKRIVFDGLDVLLALINDPQAEKEEIYRLHDWLTQSGLTGLITAKADGLDGSSLTRYGFMQFMVDCLLILEHRYVDYVSVRSARLTKYRGSGFLANEIPMVIGPRGLELPVSGEGERNYKVFTDRVSTGIERLDNMLSGGYLRGTTILLSGAPGTAKSTLAGAFVAAACQRGERAVYLSLDEGPNEIVRNLASVSIDLTPHIQANRLRLYAVSSETKNADLHLMTLQSIIRDHQPHCVVIDPLSGIVKSGGLSAALSVALRLLRLSKEAGITVLCTSLLAGANPEAESTMLQISTVADTWMHLSYVIHGGERNRALTIIKSRGTRHSNQVRELLLSDAGVTLTDVYTAGGEVLLGTARWEKEAEELAKDEQLEADLKLRSQQLEVARQQALGGMATHKEELKQHELELARLQKAQAVHQRQQGEMQSGLLHLRRGQSDSASEPENSAAASANPLPAKPARPRPARRRKAKTP